MVRIALLFALAPVLVGCVTTGRVTTVRVCATISEFTKAEQAELAKFLRAQPPGTPVDKAFRELVSLREQARSCMRKLQ